MIKEIRLHLCREMQYNFVHNTFFTVFAFVLAVFLLRSVSAGSNGDAPQEGQDWIITQDTHVWDAEVNVKDIVVTFGRTLKLENVNLTSQGYIDINGNTQWINSTIYHEQSTSGDNISVYSSLTLKNSDLTLKTILNNEEETSNKIFLGEDSTFAVSDFDNDVFTTNDRSSIQSDVTHIDNFTEKFNYTINIIGSISDKVTIDNSDFIYVNLVECNGEGSYIRNSTFSLFAGVTTDSDNFIFENNTLSGSYKWWDFSIWGDNGRVYNNTLINGTGGVALNGQSNNILANNFLNYTFDPNVSPNSYSKRGEAVLTLSNGSSNNTISNNFFHNLSSIHSMKIKSADDNVIMNNRFINSGGYWNTILVASGHRNNFNNNTFEDCDMNYNDTYWHQTCIHFTYYSWPTDYYGGEHLIENNTFNGYRSGVRFNSFQNNNTVRNNIFDLGFHAVGLWAWPQGAVAPSGTNITNNTINNTSFPISLDYFYPNWPGEDNVISSNTITNTDQKAITVWGTYKNFTIVNNYIENATLGIWIYDDLYGDIDNGVVRNNTLIDINYNGISAFTPYGVTFSLGRIEVTNNFVHTTNGAGIMFRDVDEAYIANNTVNTNISRESQLTGIYVYYVPDATIKNNTVTSAVGIEVGGSTDVFNPIIIEDNILHTNDYGIISNRTYSRIEGNNLTGFCTHDKCDILYLQKVAAVGIFSQEGEVEVRDNSLINFKEAITVVLADFNVDGNVINFAEISITANNSEGDILSNIITNNTRTLNSYKSVINIKDNSFTDFEKAIYAMNSTLVIEDNFFTDGDFCIDLIDSDYELITNDYDCREMDYQVRYNIRINIADEEGIGSEDHLFDIFNGEDNQIVDSLTGEDGLSAYFQIDIMRKEADENVVNFNPIKIIYNNNNIPVVIYKNISFNHTIIALLDTTSPVTLISPGDSLINEETITLEILLLEDEGDTMDYIVEYLVNDEFAEWEVYGIYTTSIVVFEGIDGKEYRFRSLGRDIYGNTEVKDIFEYQVEVDISTPDTYFINFEEDYYFTGSKYLELNWNSEDSDVSKQILEIYYTNFSEPYLNPNSVTWFQVNNFELSEELNYEYEFDQVGHYAFKILSEDFAGNLETKNKFDVIFNYDSDSDTLTFGDIPSRWGEDSLTIDYSTSSFNLDFDLYISLEDISDEFGYLTWYMYEYETESNTITLKGLQDDTRYYFYAVSRDLAGNIEDPLNSTEYFSSDGLYDQVFSLKYIPLIDWEYDLAVEIDEDLDGDYEALLVRGFDQNRLKNNEYYLDLSTKSIIFGGLSNGGFVPNEDIENTKNIRVTYSGVQGIFEVYSGQPESVSSLNIVPSNTTELVVSFVVPKDSKSCKVQRSTNISKGYYNEKIVEPCPAGLIEFIHTNPDLDEEYFYQILIEDEFGHESISENRSIDMKDVVKLFASNDNADAGLLGMNSIIPITALVGIIMLGFGGVLLYRSKSDDILDENVTVIESKPVAKYKVEELYLIYKDGRLVKNLSDVEVKTDSDIMSGMLTAINDFVQDSFNTEGDLGSIDYGNNKIVLQRGTHSYLAAVIYGETGNQFKGKMINAVRNIENINPTMGAWNGDAETILHTEHYLQPIIDETKQSTKEMVDNYFSEKEIVLTTSYEKIGNIIELQVHLSNYSPAGIKNCKLTPEYNNLNLGLLGINPDVFYSFSDNSFVVGELESYNEVAFKLKFQMKVAGASPVEIKMSYEQKGREGVANSLLEII